jgi:hypothetical protein
MTIIVATTLHLYFIFITSLCEFSSPGSPPG